MNFTRKLFAFLILVAIPFSTRGVDLNEEDRNALATLRVARTQAKEFQRYLEKEHSDFPLKVWFEREEGSALEQLERLQENRNTPWPSDIFPERLDHEGGKSSLSPLVSGRHWQVAKVLKSMAEFIEKLQIRKSNGRGLTLRDESHVGEVLRYFQGVDFIFSKFLPVVEHVKQVFIPYSQDFRAVFLVLQTSLQRDGRSYDPKIKEQDISAFKHLAQTLVEDDSDQPLSRASGNVEDNFIRLKLFYDAVYDTFGEILNLFGNFGRLYAMKYAELGDRSLLNFMDNIKLVGSQKDHAQ